MDGWMCPFACGLAGIVRLRPFWLVVCHVALLLGRVNALGVCLHDLLWLVCLFRSVASLSVCLPVSDQYPAPHMSSRVR